MEKFTDVREGLARPNWLIYNGGRAGGVTQSWNGVCAIACRPLVPGKGAGQQKVSVLQRAEVVNSSQERLTALLGCQGNKPCEEGLLNAAASVQFLHLDKG